MKRDPILLINVANIPPEGIERKGAVSPAGLDMPPDLHFRSEPGVQLDLFVTRVKKGVLCRGTLQAELDCMCDRCLTICRYNITLTDICHLFEDVTEDILDLTNGLREDILLAVPQHTLCAESCRGLCPQCGKNLNDGDCGCHRRSSEEEKAGIWSTLDQLDLSK